MRSNQKDQGFSLIEVLVAVLILGVGLLGVAAMQVMSLQNATTSESRTQASLLANEVAERARAKQGSLSDFHTAKVSASDCDTSAPAILVDWCVGLDQVLENAEYQVTWTAADRTLDIRLWWYERQMWAEPEEDGGAEPSGETMSNYAYQVRFAE